MNITSSSKKIHLNINLRFNRNWSSQHLLIIDNSKKYLFNKCWEIGRSNRAATRLCKVLSSGINNCRLFVVVLVFTVVPESVFSSSSLALARSRQENR